MTLFCGWTRRFSFGLAVLACGPYACANGPFKPASYGQMVEESSPMSSSGMMPGPMYESYPGQYMEPATYGEYVNGCDIGCGPDGCHMGQQFGAGLGMGDCYGEGDVCSYCGTPGCGLAGRCIGTGRSIGYFLSHSLMKVGMLAQNLRPYGEGGVATTRWFDISAEMIALKRSSNSPSTALTSLGQGPAPNIVLSTGDADADDLEPGLMLQANLQVGPGSSIETIYFGLNKWDERATAFATPGQANLFSLYSNFGTTPFGGFDDTDRSISQSVGFSSKLHNGEVNFRRRWQEPAGYFQGSFLAGIRYIDLDEELAYNTVGVRNDTVNANQLRFADFTTQARNQLVGFQLGTDLWWNLLPGIKIGTELKSGIYGNNSEIATDVFSNSLGAIRAFNETDADGRTAYVTSFSTQLWYRLSYSWAFKTSFQMLYLDNVALAQENFNAVSPAVAFAAQRAANSFIRNDGEVLFVGYTLGAEYTW